MLAACAARRGRRPARPLWRSPRRPGGLRAPARSAGCASSPAPGSPRTRRSRCAAPSPPARATGASRTCRCRFSAARPRSRTPPSTGSTADRSSTPSSPRPRCPACSRRSRSTDRHYLDGGLVNSIPLGRAVELGAGGSSCCRSGASSSRCARRGGPGRWPSWPSRSPAGTVSPATWRRVPDDVEVHVLPAGDGAAPRWDSRAALRYRDVGGAAHRIAARLPGVGGVPEQVSWRRWRTVRLPPRWVRRVVLAPAVIALTVVVVTTLPVWLLVAAAVSPLLPGRLRGAAGAVGGGGRAGAGERGAWWRCSRSGSPSGFGLLLRTPPFQQLHYRLVGWYLRCSTARRRGCCGLRVEVEGPDPGRVPRPSAAGVLPPRRARGLVPAHARPGQLVRPGAADRADRRGCSGTRRSTWCSTGCPTGSCRPAGRRRCERRIGELATALDHDDAFVIFPEGGQLHRAPPARRDRAVAGSGPGGDGPPLGGDAARAAAAARRCRRGAGGGSRGRRRLGRARRAGPPVHRGRHLARAAAGRRRADAVVAGAARPRCRRRSTHRWTGSTTGGRRIDDWVDRTRGPSTTVPVAMRVPKWVSQRLPPDRHGGPADRRTTPSP